MFKSITSAFLLLSAAALWPGSAQAALAPCDLTSAGSECTINGAIYQQGEQVPAGSDQVAFVRIGANTATTQGYNTSGRPVQFDEITDLEHTHDLLVSEVLQVQIDGTSYLQFLLDINQTQANPLISLDKLQVFGSNTGGNLGYPAIGTLVYDMDAGGDSWVKLNNLIEQNAGSGDTDMTFLLPASLLSGFSHVYLFSQFGTNFANNAGFEEWIAVIPEPSVVWLLALA